MRFRTVTPIYPVHKAISDTTLAVRNDKVSHLEPIILSSSQIKGFDIPSETVLALNYESVAMDENYWVDPERFRPERFLTAEGNLRKEERHMPFGKGKLFKDK